MRFMLDTNICIDLIRKRPPGVIRRLLEASPADVCLSAITLSELEYGVCRSAAPDRNRLALAEFMAPLSVLPYGDAEAPVYGRIRSDLARRGMGIGALDTLIAAHALAANLTLVTSNEREFRRVPGLRVTNWAA